MKLIILSFVTLATLSTCTINKHNSDMKASHPPSDIPAVIHKYVSEQKHWKAKEYSIKEDRRQDGCIVYTIRYLPDENITYPGGGQSIEVYYDPSKHAIVKEFGFQ